MGLPPHNAKIMQLDVNTKRGEDTLHSPRCGGGEDGVVWRLLPRAGWLVLLPILLQQGQGMILLQTTCPVPKPSVGDEVGVCANLCTTNSECNSDSWCCPTSCGGHQCTVVKAPCQVGDIMYSHHDLMTTYSPDPDTCGTCWCQNGNRECVDGPDEHGCSVLAIVRKTRGSSSRRVLERSKLVSWRKDAKRFPSLALPSPGSASHIRESHQYR
ncbi:hypothetical protein RRG08_018403 [Elysia crispata]|uniref:Uncharacterized protein n=1 Tax=Elysia crispata TaxID=231223 RepID=A0AAE0ZE78_9GAST|nr:hypothetical protein RRG08_018403 [Elysia crispata]